MTGELDRWDSQDVPFVFGMDAHPKVVKLAQALPEKEWQPLERLPRYEIATEPRTKPDHVQEQVVRGKGYVHKVLVGESVAEMDDQPGKCAQACRLVVVRKNISVRAGERVLLEDVRYFFYLTNHPSYTGPELVSLANGRGDQEKVIEQLKNGGNARRRPVNDLLSNWAYLVMTSLAWNLKAWFGWLLPDRVKGLALMGMEFRRFLHARILVPAQIVRSGRKIIYRIMSDNSWVKDRFAFWERMRRMPAT